MSTVATSSLGLKKRTHVIVEEFTLLSWPDPLVAFDSVLHKYYYDGEEMDTSVTKHVDYYTGDKFDGLVMAGHEFAFCRRFAQNPDDPRWTEYQRKQYAKYKDCKTPEEIQTIWEAARDNGTTTHESIHLLLSGKADDSERFNTIEMMQFRAAHAYLRHQYYPLMSEVCIAMPQISTGGSIDAVYAVDDSFINRSRKKVAIVEFKTMPMPNNTGIIKHCKHPFDCITRSKIGKVTIQTSFYGKMLQIIGNYEIVAVFAIYLHPSMPKYGLLSLPFLDLEMDQVMTDLAFRRTLRKMPTRTLSEIIQHYKAFVNARKTDKSVVWTVLVQETDAAAASATASLSTQSTAMASNDDDEISSFGVIATGSDSSSSASTVAAIAPIVGIATS